MTSVKVKFRPSSVASTEGTVYYQIIHERKVRQLSTSYHLYPQEWDAGREMVRVPANISFERKNVLFSIREEIARDLERLNRIIGFLDDHGVPYSSDIIIEEFRRYVREFTLFRYMERIIGRLREKNNIRTAETYNSTLRSFHNFRKGEDVMLDCLTPQIMEAFEAWHRNRGNTPNTISFYTRILRAVYNRAVDDNIISNRYPFKRVYTGIEKTVKRAIPLSYVSRICKLNLSSAPSLAFARDMFMMSFYFRGMSFVDMAFLRKKDLREGYVIYRRRKTGQVMSIRWTREMQDILDRYPVNPTQYLLPIIKNVGVNERCAYHNAGFRINHNLKKIAAMAGINVPLTMYVARHSWASAAKEKGIPVSVISEGMGHERESTTLIYLASLDNSVVDKANSLIISSL